MTPQSRIATLFLPCYQIISMPGVNLERQETLQRYVSYSRDIALGPLLWRIGCDKPDIRLDLFNRMQNYKPLAYTAWLVVRKSTGQSLVNSNKMPLIGTEGYFAGIASHAEEIIVREAQIGLGMLDILAKLHSYDWGFRNNVRQTALGIKCQPDAFIELNSMVGAELARLRAMRWSCPPPVRNTNDAFRSSNYNIALGLPSTRYALTDDCDVTVTHFLPPQASIGNHPNYRLLPLNGKQQEGYAFFDGACRVTMPLIRAALSMT